jgi:hypothetical protein
VAVYQALADAVLLLHFAVVLFVISGPVFIVAGNLRSWRWVNNLVFRVAHLLAIAFVVAESWLGMTCPLTALEMRLRGLAGGASYQAGFVEHWVGRMLFYQAPPLVFTLLYTAFGGLVVAAWCLFPPWSPKRLHHASQ